MEKVREIIENVKENGDKAVKKYAALFDKTRLVNFKLGQREINQAFREVDEPSIKEIKKAISNIKSFAKKQSSQYKNFEYSKEGITLGQRVTPLERVGIYVPGGNYSLPSTALMCIVPAKVAGVKEIIVCSPKIKPVTIVAAVLAGADKIFNIGGVQAIAAMAYGTKQVPKVDKVVGPGNVYVTAAKKEIFGDCGIDLLAGPTEILLVADKKANVRFVAADLLGQAEHDAEAKIIFITNSKEFLNKVNNEIKKQTGKMATKGIIGKSLKNKKVILVKNIKEAIDIANKEAPEHLSLQIKNPKKYFKQLTNYGSLFLGKYSAVAFGDYCSGANHVLPTEKTARFTGGLSVKDFFKIQTYQQISKEGMEKLSKTAIKFAELEGLDAHKKSIEIRKNGKRY